MNLFILFWHTFHGNLQAYFDLVGDFVPCLLKLMLNIWELVTTDFLQGNRLLYGALCSSYQVYWTSPMYYKVLLRGSLDSGHLLRAWGSQQLLMTCQGYNVTVLYYFDQMFTILGNFHAEMAEIFSFYLRFFFFFFFFRYDGWHEHLVKIVQY